MSDTELEASFSVLPARLKRRIDRAFDNALIEAGHSAQTEPGPSRKKRKLNAPTGDGGFISSAPGGFLVEDSESALGGLVVDDIPAGGFLPTADDAVTEGTRTSESSEDEDVPSHTAHTHIPLTLIPAALQLLDLQPDDEDVLAVFRNAASGWEGPQGNSASNPTELHVSRKDWRAVCAALLDTSAGEDGDGSRHDEEEEEEEENPVEALESGEESEDYVDSGEDESDRADSGDEYLEGSFTRTTNRKSSTRSGRNKQRREETSDSGSDSDIENRRLKRVTPRQREECRRSFALFFPDVPDEELETQRIMIKDISRVAALLKEKITAEQIIEMLEVFSTSPDKSMSLSDFERMMIVAKLA